MGRKPAVDEECGGIIDARKAYTIRAFCKEIGIAKGGHVWQELRRAGLKIRNNRYITGQDFLNLLLGQSTDETKD